MAWCLMAPSHYLNQCWLITREAEWFIPWQFYKRHLTHHSLRLAWKLHIWDIIQIPMEECLTNRTGLMICASSIRTEIPLGAWIRPVGRGTVVPWWTLVAFCGARVVHVSAINAGCGRVTADGTIVAFRADISSDCVWMYKVIYVWITKYKAELSVINNNN